MLGRSDNHQRYSIKNEQKYEGYKYENKKLTKLTYLRGKRYSIQQLIQDRTKYRSKEALDGGYSVVGKP